MKLLQDSIYVYVQGE